MEAARPLMLAVAIAAAVTLAPIAGAAGGGNASAAPGTPPDSARQRELLVLLKQDCGSCHGMRLTGGLGPALTPEALRTKPAESLAATIVYGRTGTAMPPWRRFMSEAEASWLVARMIDGATDVGPR